MSSDRLTEILSTRVTRHTYDLVCRLTRERGCEISELLRDLVEVAAEQSDAEARAAERARALAPVESSAITVP